MTTMAKAIRAYVESAGGRVTAEQIRQHINEDFPGRWKPNTLQAHFSACVVNNPNAYIHHPSTEKFLYRHSDGTFEMYSDAVHGENEWMPIDDDEVPEVNELVETSISLERDIEDHLIAHLDAIETGLKFVARQASTEAGRIDILAEDIEGRRVVIEVKVGEAKDSSVGQIARYIGWYAKSEGKPARGILIAGSYSDGVRYASAAIPGLILIAYRVNFSFETISV